MLTRKEYGRGVISHPYGTGRSRTLGCDYRYAALVPDCLDLHLVSTVSCCVAMGKLLNLFVPLFPHLYMSDNSNAYFT